MHLPEPHIWTEAARGGYADPDDLAKPGIERMRHFVRPGAAQPPISHLTGLRFVEVGVGSATCTMPVTRWLLAATASYPGGVLALVADGALGGALITVLEPGQILTTSELSLSYLRPVVDAQHLVARGRLVHAARTMGLAEVFIQDDRGRLLAHGSSRCVFMPAPPGQKASRPPRSDSEASDPHLRPAIGETVEPLFTQHSYIELFERWQRNELPAPPLCNFTGLRPVEHTPDSMTWRMPASEWLNNAFGSIYGGALALLADSAVAGAIWMSMNRGEALASLNLHMYFFRPVFADGRDMVGKGQLARSGRSLRVARAELFDAEGNLVALATGSGKVISDRPTSLRSPREPDAHGRF